MMSDVGTLLIVWMRDSSTVRCLASNLAKLEAAMNRYLGVEMSWQEGFDRNDRDSLLELTTTSGAPVRLLTSFVTGWMVTTPETRRLERQLEIAIEQEKKAHAAALKPGKSGNSASAQ